MAESDSSAAAAASSPPSSKPPPAGGAPPSKRAVGRAGKGTPQYAPGAFCVFCATQSPPLLARHPYVDCYQRMLSGIPQVT